MIDRWNSVLRPGDGDEIWHLGDHHFGQAAARTEWRTEEREAQFFSHSVIRSVYNQSIGACPNRNHPPIEAALDSTRGSRCAKDTGISTAPNAAWVISSLATLQMIRSLSVRYASKKVGERSTSSHGRAKATTRRIMPSSALVWLPEQPQHAWLSLERMTVPPSSVPPPAPTISSAQPSDRPHWSDLVQPVR